MHHTIQLRTDKGDSLTNITDEVRRVIQQSGVQSGICFVLVPHTTAAITINSHMDPATAQDIISDIRRLVPTRTDFHHVFDTPSDAAGHIKATLVGHHVALLIEEGEMVLGHSQGILFYDFDGPRQRRVQVKLIPA